MMKRMVMVFAVLALLAAVCPAFCAEDGGAQGRLVAPPAIYIPAGGKIVTEINLRDEDVLGMIKQIIPAAAEVAKGALGKMIDGHVRISPGAGVPLPLAVVNELDVEGFVEAIDGIKAVRVLIVKYPKSTNPQEIIKQFDTGAAKAGVFSKMIWDTGFFPGAVAVYAAPDNGGFVGLAYNASENTLYAARIVGFVDVAKLTKWAANTAKMFSTRGSVAIEDSPEVEMPAPEVNRE